MKKQYFHKGLYIDQLKQLRFIGFIALGLLSLMAILTPIGRAISAARMEDISGGVAVIRRASVAIASSHYFLFFVFCIFVPILTLACFHYLTKRNSSDFYHSLPHTRTCVYTCNIAAIVTWTTILVWVPTVLSIIMYTIFSKYLVLEILLLLRFALFIYVASLLVVASISIACSLTGTVFTNVVVSGLIIFLPRIMILVFSNLIVGSSNLLVSDHLFPLIDYQYNAIIGLLSFVESNADMGWGTFLYSTILTILYLFLGLLVYRHRKSETAGQSAISRKVQATIRLILGTAVSLIPIAMIINMITDPDSYGPEETPMLIYYLFILYLVACMVMFLYELITTKKLKNVVKALPSIGILAIINVVITFSALGLYNMFLNYSPDAEDIDYIITERPYTSDDLEYYDALANTIKVKDKEALKLVADCLKSNIESEKNHEDIYYGDATNVIVGIHSGLTTHYRRLTMTTKEQAALLKIYSQYEDYVNAYQKLPELKGNKISLYDLNLSDSDYMDLYNTAREEILTLNFADWYKSLLREDDRYPIDTITFYGVAKNESLIGTIPITDLLPKTFQKYLTLSEKKQQNDKAVILSRLKELEAVRDLETIKKEAEDNSYYSNYLHFTIIDLQENFITNVASEPIEDSNKSQQQITLDRDFMEKLITKNKDISSYDMGKDCIIKVSYDYYDAKKKAYKTANYNFILEKTSINEYLTALNEGTYYNTVE